MYTVRILSILYAYPLLLLATGTSHYPITLTHNISSHLRSADVLSGRHIVRVTFCHGFLIDVLSGRHFVSTYFVRHFVRKTFCQFSFFVVGFCIDVLSGRQIVRIHFDHISGMLTLFMVCLRYIWYFDHISGMLTLLSQKWPKMNQNGLK